MINGKTRLCGIFGYPVGHSLSPAMHNAAFAALGLDWAYLPFAVEPGQLRSAVEGIRAMGLVGVNITVPHKESVLPLLDELSEEARLIGAVNTIVNRGGRLLGDNTDGHGFISALREETGFQPAGKTALIIGAGGAAKAVSVRLALSGVREMYVTNRTGKGAEDLAKLLQKCSKASIQVIPWPEQAGETLSVKADLTVQTTTVGMSQTPDAGFFGFGKAATSDAKGAYSSTQLSGARKLTQPRAKKTSPDPDAGFLPLVPWESGQVVCDLIYNPVETRFMACAREKGATVMNGLGMLLHQGALAFRIWTGQAAPLEVMKQTLCGRFH